MHIYQTLMLSGTLHQVQELHRADSLDLLQYHLRLHLLSFEVLNLLQGYRSVP